MYNSLIWWKPALWWEETKQYKWEAHGHPPVAANLPTCGQSQSQYPLNLIEWIGGIGQHANWLSIPKYHGSHGFLKFLLSWRKLWGKMTLFFCCYCPVILDAPTGMTSDVWSLAVPLIAKVTKVNKLSSNPTLTPTFRRYYNPVFNNSLFVLDFFNELYEFKPVNLLWAGHFKTGNFIGLSWINCIRSDFFIKKKCIWIIF